MVDLNVEQMFPGCRGRTERGPSGVPNEPSVSSTIDENGSHSEQEDFRIQRCGYRGKTTGVNLWEELRPWLYRERAAEFLQKHL